jgi:hypothetical protein
MTVKRIIWRVCPRCRKRVAVRVEQIGFRGKCPHCLRVMQITRRAREEP